MTKTLDGPQWPEPVRVLSETASEYGFITIEAVGLTSGRHYSTVLWPKEMPAAATSWHPDFNADADVWRLLIEAERLKLAYSCDPLVARTTAWWTCSLTNWKRSMMSCFHSLLFVT